MSGARRQHGRSGTPGRCPPYAASGPTLRGWWLLGYSNGAVKLAATRGWGGHTHGPPGTVATTQLTSAARRAAPGLAIASPRSSDGGPHTVVALVVCSEPRQCRRPHIDPPDRRRSAPSTTPARIAGRHRPAMTTRARHRRPRDAPQCRSSCGAGPAGATTMSPNDTETANRSRDPLAF